MGELVGLCVDSGKLHKNGNEVYSWEVKLICRFRSHIVIAWVLRIVLLYLYARLVHAMPTRLFGGWR